MMCNQLVRDNVVRQPLDRIRFANCAATREKVNEGLAIAVVLTLIGIVSWLFWGRVISG